MNIYITDYSIKASRSNNTDKRSKFIVLTNKDFVNGYEKSSHLEKVDINLYKPIKPYSHNNKRKIF